MAETDPDLRHIAASVHGRYLLRVPEGVEPEVLVVGFHGYGEGAAEAMLAVEKLVGERPWARAAIQALHPFYRRRDGAVVSCWMTRLDRELAIADNIGYVDRVLSAIRREVPSIRRTGVVGFSQGVAIAYRTVAHTGHPCDALVVLAGDVPPDVYALDLPGFPPVLIGRGWNEKLYTASQLSADLATLGRMGVSARAEQFDGGHEWSPVFVEAATRFLDDNLAERPTAVP